jgi:parallel beta-helix repeat protein
MRFAPIFLATLLLAVASPPNAGSTTYYVRQTVGDDAHDGTSPKTAWLHLAKLSAAMHAGDTAYVGPGLYREEIVVTNDGSPAGRLVFVADTTGQHTGDPPGVVLVAGSDPVAPAVFTPHSAPGVYTAPFPERVWGAVELDGPQRRYADANRDHRPETIPLDSSRSRRRRTSTTKPRSASISTPATAARRRATTRAHPSRQRHPDGRQAPRHGHGVHLPQHAGRRHQLLQGVGRRIAINNTAWGSRQGIRVYGATDVLVSGNTLFRNENSGVYFAAESVNGVTIGNTAYENVKGLRWSSDSVNGLALDNVAFANDEAGIALENADRAILRGNRLVDNGKYQLLVIKTAYSSESNCFATGRPGQLVAEFFPYFATDHHRTLAEYQGARHADLHSREGGCAPLPAKVDVRQLQTEAAGYAARAREILGAASR